MTRPRPRCLRGLRGVLVAAGLAAVVGACSRETSNVLEEAGAAIDWPACDDSAAEPWVREMRDRVLRFDELAAYAVRSYGPPTTCRWTITAEFDGMEFGSLHLGFADRAAFLVETMPPEASLVTLRAPGGLPDPATARQVLESYAADIGVAIDWTAPEVTVDDAERVETFRDPEPGLNASASLVYIRGSLIELRFGMAL